MTLNPLTLPPTAPSRSDPPATFITRADAFINWWSGTFAPEFNALLPEIVLAGSANNYGATSTTSLAIGTGSKSLTVQADKAFQIGQFVQIANTATPANYMFGQVTAYNASTGALTVLVSAVGGSGTFAAWTIGLAATGGAYAQLAGATFTGGVTAPNVNVDATGSMYLSAGNYFLQADTGDYWFFHRTSSFWRAVIGSSVRMDITATGGKLYGDWTHEGVTYFNNDPNFSAFVSGAAANLVMDSGDWIAYDRTGNAYNFNIANVTRFQVTPTQALVSNDPVVTRTSTDSLTNKSFGSAPFPTPAGSAPLYPARAWVNFNGTGTVAINASGNVSSITDNGVGDYTINFATAMPDAAYAWAGSTQDINTDLQFASVQQRSTDTKTTTACRLVICATSATNLADNPEVSIIFVR